LTAKILACGLAVVVIGGACTTATTPTPTPVPTISVTATPTDPGESALPTAVPATPDPTVTPSETPTETPDPTAAPQAVEMPFVPVVSFWSTRVSMPLDEVRNALAGSSSRYSRVIVGSADADALGASASVERGSVQEVIAAVKEGALGFLRATDAVPAVRALGIGGVNLFGNDRTRDIADWPLVAVVSAAGPWRQEASWTLVAAGDIMGDRGVREAYESNGGPEYLFNGGTSEVVRLRCCSFYNYTYPVVRRTGNAGLVRQMFQDADFAMANLETGVLENPPHRERGFTFVTEPEVLAVLQRGGIDFLSNANNHSKNGGARGLSTAIETLDELGILHAGAGVGESEAAKPAITEVDGVKLAIISCDAIARYYWAKPGKLGTNSCKEGSVTQTIHEIRDSVDVIIVFPHWGIEYELPAAYQFRLSREWIDAGADMIIGAHNHFPGGIYEYNGHVSMLSMGNFMFDQDFRQTTLQGLVVETTWNVNQLLQIWVHPLLNVDAQPNFADPATDGQWAFDIMKWQSKPGKLDWGGTQPNFTSYPMR
jgi:poly-gamma-glutamate capsule biosynthesis protein CapA/YwtB (metallophosphatase superfamily)